METPSPPERRLHHMVFSRLPPKTRLDTAQLTKQKARSIVQRKAQRHKHKNTKHKTHTLRTMRTRPLVSTG
ncbi:Hypothetical protein J6889_00493 [Nakaseomyces glabratus]|nr:hypothetical protein J7298_00495 [Nakaseomyces glabratus]KAH7607810.1 hypothetical protein J7295_00496 [Nakaseomyces glabratus]KAH7614961.1 hypothetical protein J7292_00493 [Nakaseomyces glabratus]